MKSDITYTKVQYQIFISKKATFIKLYMLKHIKSDRIMSKNVESFSAYFFRREG